MVIDIFVEITININDRLFSDIETSCKNNGTDVKTYIENAVSDHFYTEKYGDLNKILKKDEKVTEIKKVGTEIVKTKEKEIEDVDSAVYDETSKILEITSSDSFSSYTQKYKVKSFEYKYKQTQMATIFDAVDVLKGKTAEPIPEDIKQEIKKTSSPRKRTSRVIKSK